MNKLDNGSLPRASQIIFPLKSTSQSVHQANLVDLLWHQVRWGAGFSSDPYPSHGRPSRRRWKSGGNGGPTARCAQATSCWQPYKHSSMFYQHFRGQGNEEIYDTTVLQLYFSSTIVILISWETFSPVPLKELVSPLDYRKEAIVERIAKNKSVALFLDQNL